MAHSAALKQQMDAALGQALAEGVLDDQFQQLLSLQDDSNADFVAEVTSLFFEDSTGKLDKMQGIVSSSALNFNDLDALVHQFKGSSASLGAHTIAQLCVRMREACQARNQPACQELLADIKQVRKAIWGARVDDVDGRAAPGACEPGCQAAPAWPPRGRLLAAPRWLLLVAQQGGPPAHAACRRAAHRPRSLPPRARAHPRPLPARRRSRCCGCGWAPS
jgi:histidine-containing phosphotransfer protein